jgi:glycerol dehydrogenase-like iron-containing ADH family enzyme
MTLLTLDRVLQKVADLGIDPSNVPELFLIQSATELCARLSAVLDQVSRASANAQIVLVHDGVSKVCLHSSPSGAQRDVMDFVQECLGQSLLGHPSLQKRDVVVLELSPAHGFPESRSLATQAAAAELAQRVLANGKALVVIAIGSGSLVDVTKHAVWIAEQSGAEVDFSVVPTALTVTAFTSAFAVLGDEGHKVTRASRLPDRTLFVLPILEGAPKELTRAGVGDLAAGFVSYADWYLASELGLAHDYNPKAVALMGDLQRYLLPGAVSMDNGQSMQELACILAAAGIAMNVGASSAPQSGGEHATSHVIDLLRHLSGRERWLHGLQVGLTSQFSCSLYEWLRDLEFIPAARIMRFSKNELEEIVERTFWLAPFTGSPMEFASAADRQVWIDAHRTVLDAELARIQAEAWSKAQDWAGVHARIHAVQERWPQVRAEIEKLTISPKECEQLALRWQLPLFAEAMSPPGHVAEVRWALRFSVFFRRRFGIQDLVFWLGEDPVLAAAI